MLIQLFLVFLLLGKVFAQDASQSANIVAPIVSVSPTTIPTQIPDLVDVKFQQYKTDYLFNRDVYNQAYLDYTTKKQVHTRYGTIITQKEKLEATRTSLIARNTMLRSYLMALRTILDKYQVQNPTETEKAKIDLSKWEAWLNEQNSVVNSLIGPEDFKKNAQDFKQKYVTMQQTIYSAWVQHQVNLELLTLNKLNLLKTEIENTGVKPEGQQPLSEIAIKSDFVLNNIKSALDNTKKEQYTDTFNNFYPSSRLFLAQGKSYLQEISQNLQGIVIRFLNPTL